MIPITQDLITSNYTARASRHISYIVVHYFGSLGTDEGVANYFDMASADASAHYALDEDSITQIVLDNNIAWHCGDSGRGTLKGLCTNANSIGIEVKPCKVNEKRWQYATDTDWYFDERTVANLRDLVRYLMAKHGIDAAHVVRHFDVTGKYCPRPWMGDDINSYYGRTGNQLWAEFKAGLEDDDMDISTFKELMGEYRAELQDNDSGEYSEKAREWAEKNGLVQGAGEKAGEPNMMWQDFLTREQAVTLFYRFALLMGKA